MNVCFETFGCRLNKAEALQMEAEYASKGWTLTPSHAEADLIIVRGCSVTASAQHDCEKLIAHLKRKYPHKKLLVCGCLKDKSATPRQPLLHALEKTAGDTAVPVPTRTARAYLKIQDGCAGTCTFCIVPKFRGKSVSTPFTDVLDTASRFMDVGYHEIVVTGCNLSLYASEGLRLPELLSALAERAKGSCRIRLGSLEPGGCARETVRAMSEHENICRFLHLPVQSGSNRILYAMKRPYVVKDVEELVSEARKLMPSVGLGCDLMTGFPGESELDFMATQGLLRRLSFSNVHAFPFSERPGTPAATLPGIVPRNLRSSRAHELARMSRETRKTFAQAFVGQLVDVVIEDETRRLRWTGEYLRCKVLVGTPVKRKDLVSIRVKRADEDTLIGQLVRTR